MRGTQNKITKLHIVLSYFLAAFLWFSICVCGAKTMTLSVAAEENTDVSQRVIGYLPNWSYGAYRTIDFSTLTHINIAFCNPNSRGELQAGIPDAEMETLVDKAHQNNVKILAALGGGGGCDGYYALINTPEKISAFNEQIVSFCEKYDLDGIDLDIELDSSNVIWKPYKTWVEQLRIICDEKGWLLSTATAQWVAGSVSNETFALFDYLNVMAYDNDDGSVKSHASYEFAVECLNYFHNNKGVSKDKLALGVPFYGRGYNADGSLNWNSYESFSDLIAVDASNFNIDVYDGVAYNGADTIRKKCELAKDYGGIMIWEISQDAGGEYSLLSVIKEEILTEPSQDKVPSDDDQNPNVQEQDNPLEAKTIIIVVLICAFVAACVCAAIIFIVKKER